MKVDNVNRMETEPNISRPVPICRQFWKAGNYEVSRDSKSRVQCNRNYLHVHPKFLHSNATSHKWAFGAIAELVDNAIDEIQNGATYAIVDKISDPRDGSPTLLIQDNGGGMAPEAMRCCMSFGFSEKKSESAIGQYGNGFKTSTMRLGADVIVFSRHVDETDRRTSTQSIGLLSYTYLSREGLDRIVVPMVDYKYNLSTSSFEPLYHNGKELFQLNLSTILQWSPYSTEVDLLKQDICLQCPELSEKTRSNKLSEEHFGNQFRYSLRPFWNVVNFKFKGKGVVGVLEANFIEPTHNKQDFERTSLFQKLETRLKEMTSEYWDYHCGLVGYHQVKKRTQGAVSSPDSSYNGPINARYESVRLNKGLNLGPTMVNNISAEAFLWSSRSTGLYHGIKPTQVEVLSVVGEKTREVSV